MAWLTPCLDLARIAVAHDIFFHVDADFGGMVIPFLKNPVPFDFSLKGVASIAVDPHKMGLSTIPAGCLLTREPDILKNLNIDTPYLSVKQEYTLAGTRPESPVVGALAVLDYLGFEGMQAVVSGCMKNTGRLIAGMETFGIPRVITRMLTWQHLPAGITKTLESLVDTTGTPSDSLHAPCSRRPH